MSSSNDTFFGQPKPKSSHTLKSLPITILRRSKAYALLTLQLTIGILLFVCTFSLWPIKLVSPTLFRRAVTFYLDLTMPGFVCIIFSWNKTKLFTNGIGTMKGYKGKNLLMLANHNARVDWVFGLFLGTAQKQRVGFVTEAFIMFLPFLGWFRYIVEDMFVFRSFKRDKVRLEKNIQSFHDSKVTRWVFLCPEGHIADFNAADQQYIKDCEEFCKQMGIEPYEMCLTPRYKGLQCFNQIVNPKSQQKKVTKVLSVVMTYVKDGVRLGKPLRSSQRVVPDLFMLMTPGTECHCHVHELELSNDPALMKEQILRDYHFKDKLLKEFYETGSYSAGMPGKSFEDSPENWKVVGDPELKDPRHLQQLPPSHLSMNASFFGQLFSAYYVMQFLGLAHWIPVILLSLFSILAVSHLIGETLADGQSRESLPFEGILKAVMFRLKGIEGKNAAEPVQSDGTQHLDSQN